MKEVKKPVTFRLPDATVKELESLAKRHSVSQAQVISILVHHYTIGADMDALDEWFNVVSLS
jgi:predicted DNA-binding protein